MWCSRAHIHLSLCSTWHRHDDSVLHQPTWLEIRFVHVSVTINLFHMSNTADPPFVSSCVYVRSWWCEGVAVHPGGKWSLPCVIPLAVNHYRPYQWSTAGVLTGLSKCTRWSKPGLEKSSNAISSSLLSKSCCKSCNTVRVWRSHAVAVLYDSFLFFFQLMLRNNRQCCQS